MQETSRKLLHTTNHYFKKIMKKTLFIGLFLVLLAPAVAQENTVSLKTTGSAETKEKAVQYALRSAIEQAFGAFISSNTEILNDELVADEITSVASGNIEKYDILSETVNEEGNSWFVTVNVKVSVGKLTEFVQAKGVEVEIKGGMYAINIKQQQLNEESEYISILNFYKVFHNQMLDAFDYTLEVGSPTKSGTQNWNISMDVTTKANDNMAFCENLLYTTLKGLSMTDEEVEQYKSLKKEVYALEFVDEKWPKFKFWTEPSGSTTPLTKTIYNGDTLPCHRDRSIAHIYYAYPSRVKERRKGGQLTSLLSDFPYLTKEDFMNANPAMTEPSLYDAAKDKFNWDIIFLNDFYPFRIPTFKTQVYYLRNDKSAALIERIKKNLKGLNIYNDESDFLFYGTGFDIVSEIAEYKSYPLTKVTPKKFTNSECADDFQEWGSFPFEFFTKKEELNTKVKILKLKNWSRDNYNRKYETGPNVKLSFDYTYNSAFQFPASGTTVIETPFKCTLTLEQLESVRKFEVKKSDNMVSINNGGFVIPGSNFATMVSTIITKLTTNNSRDDAISFCESSKEFGYDDWHLTDAFSGIEIAKNNPIVFKSVQYSGYVDIHSTTVIRDYFVDHKQRYTDGEDIYWKLSRFSGLEEYDGSAGSKDLAKDLEICIRKIR